jgi:hypothetical protein
MTDHPDIPDTGGNQPAAPNARAAHSILATAAARARRRTIGAYRLALLDAAWQCVELAEQLPGYPDAIEVIDVTPDFAAAVAVLRELTETAYLAIDEDNADHDGVHHRNAQHAARSLSMAVRSRYETSVTGADPAAVQLVGAVQVLRGRLTMLAGAQLAELPGGTEQT